LHTESLLARLVGLLSENRTDTPWMDRTQVAEYLGVTERQVRSWTETGTMPYSKQGKAVRYHRERVDEWLLSQPTQRRERCRSRR